VSSSSGFRVGGFGDLDGHDDGDPPQSAYTTSWGGEVTLG